MTGVLEIKVKEKELKKKKKMTVNLVQNGMKSKGKVFGDLIWGTRKSGQVPNPQEMTEHYNIADGNLEDHLGP